MLRLFLNKMIMTKKKKGKKTGKHTCWNIPRSSNLLIKYVDNNDDNNNGNYHISSVCHHHLQSKFGFGRDNKFCIHNDNITWS